MRIGWVAEAGTNALKDGLGKGEQSRLVVPEPMARQPGLEESPHPLDQIEFGTVRRQPQHVDPVGMVPEPVPQRCGFVVRGVVQYQNDGSILPLVHDLFDEAGKGRRGRLWRDPAGQLSRPVLQRPKIVARWLTPAAGIGWGCPRRCQIAARCGWV